MVNVDFSPALVLGMGLIGGGLALYQLRRARPSVSRDFDVVASSVAIFSGGILVFQGWRLDPLLLFCQLLTAGMALSFAVEALRLREEVVEGGGGASEGLGGGAALPPPYDTRVRGGRQRGSSEGASFQQQQQQQPQDDYYYDNNNSSYYGPGAGLPPPRQGSVSPEDYFAGGSNSSSRWGGAAERGGEAPQPDCGGAADIMRYADMAMYRAKNEGRNRACVYDAAMDADLSKRKLLEGDLRQAIEEGQLRLMYQPIVNKSGDTMMGVEALCRWTHPTRGEISPIEFIAIAEHSGLIVELGAWVLRQALIDGRAWPSLTVAVNVSPLQFRRADFAELVERTLLETGFDPSRL